uniref:Oxidative stress-induced growth inhibitor 2 n=1 Tax=Rhabditophanes sp. KR3021 TaxID=114890 RepID=A0AC35TYI0_9BILA
MDEDYLMGTDSDSPISEMSEEYWEYLCSSGEDDFTPEQQQTPTVDKKVVVDADVCIIGNGPAGISLSAFLAGWHPIYDGSSEHPNSKLHHRLLHNNHTPDLLYQDLSWYEDEFPELIKPNVRRTSNLLDTLARPNDGLMLNGHKNENTLKVTYNPEAAISHMVLGEGPIGGSWNTYDSEMVSVSLANGMELPGYTFADFLDPQLQNARLPSGVVKNYLQKYVEKLGLEKNFVTSTRVVSLEKVCHTQTGQEYWNVFCEGDGIKYKMSFNKIVIACGKNVIKRLQVSCFHNLSSNTSLAGLKAALDTFNKTKSLDVCCMERKTSDYDSDEECFPHNLTTLFSCRSKTKVVVIGDGISAADSVKYCLARGIEVIHVIRKNERQMRSSVIARLSPAIYPEYSAVFNLMIGRTANKNYRRFIRSTVNTIQTNDISISTPIGDVTEKFNLAVACIGRTTSGCLPLSQYQFNHNYQSTQDTSLFAIGSFAGDHFIRYLVGGALEVARTLLNPTRPGF